MNKTITCTIAFLLTAGLLTVFSPSVRAERTGYTDLGYFDFANAACSLQIAGTARVYDQAGYSGHYMDVSSPSNIPDLSAVTTNMPPGLNWNKRISSLTVDGSITLFDQTDYYGRSVTFTNSPDLHQGLSGCVWNANPTLIQSQGQWDSRVQSWNLNYLALDSPDSTNYINWLSDNTVSSACHQDSSHEYWAVCNFDQGYWVDQSSISDLSNCGLTDENCFAVAPYVRSMKFTGTVTLYELKGFQGAHMTFTNNNGAQGWIPDLTAVGWSDSHTTRSMTVSPGSMATVYNYKNYVHMVDNGLYMGELTFTAPSYQPPLLRLGDTDSITLWASVSDWFDSTPSVAGWTGVKFDIWAVQDPSRLNGDKVMIELYCKRSGANLLWWMLNFGENDYLCKVLGLKNMLAAIDTYPGFEVTRIIHPNNIVTWQIDVHYFLWYVGNWYAIPIWDWYLAQMSFTVEASGDGNPSAGCKLHEMWLTYTYPPPTPGGGGGTGCPYVSSWNGTHYALDNNLLPASQKNSRTSNGTDVTDSYRLEQTPVRGDDGTYSLLLSEFEHEHSYIDQVKLEAVDHPANVKTALTPEGKVLTYTNPSPPISAVDNHANDRLGQINTINGNASDPSTYFFGQLGDSLTLNFSKSASDIAKLIIRTDMLKEKECIDVQILNQQGQWQNVDTVLPRDYWSTSGVDLSPYIVKGKDFMVRLVWREPHRLDFVGLDTSPQAQITVNSGLLLSATHSVQGDVTFPLLFNDGRYAELIPGQSITLNFVLPRQTSEARDYVIIVIGHYFTIS